MKRNGWMVWLVGGAILAGSVGGCAQYPGWLGGDPGRVVRPTHEQRLGPPYDRPFPLGQVTDAHWETQQTNAEAADFILYDHEFIGNTAKLTPKGQKHLVQMAVRLEHVPFPIVIEQSPDGKYPQLDAQRRQAVIQYLVAMGYEKERIENRVVIAPAFAEGLRAIEGEAAYYSTFQGQFYGGTGRRYGGRGGYWR